MKRRQGERGEREHRNYIFDDTIAIIIIIIIINHIAYRDWDGSGRCVRIPSSGSRLRTAAETESARTSVTCPTLGGHCNSITTYSNTPCTIRMITATGINCCGGTLLLSFWVTEIISLQLETILLLCWRTNLFVNLWSSCKEMWTNRWRKTRRDN